MKQLSLFDEEPKVFDVVIGNPPYQKIDNYTTIDRADVVSSLSASPIYHLFFERSKELSNKILYITPSKGFSAGKGLDIFRWDKIRDKSFKIMHDYFDSSMVFDGIELKGGVCGYLYDNDYWGKCDIYAHYPNYTERTQRFLFNDKYPEIYIRTKIQIDILDQIWSLASKSFKERICKRNIFGLESNALKKDDPRFKLIDLPPDRAIEHYPANKVCVYGKDKQNKTIRVGMDKSELKGRDYFPDKVKVFISKSHSGNATPFIADPECIATETYNVILCDDYEEAYAICCYLVSKFGRFLVNIYKNTQHFNAKECTYLPDQFFKKGSDINGGVDTISETGREKENKLDKQLYDKYALSKDMREYINNYKHIL